MFVMPSAVPVPRQTTPPAGSTGGVADESVQLMIDWVGRSKASTIVAVTAPEASLTERTLPARSYAFQTVSMPSTVVFVARPTRSTRYVVIVEAGSLL